MADKSGDDGKQKDPFGDQTLLSDLASGVLVVIPAYREAQVIGNVVRDALRYCDNVVVVADGSPDGTADEALAAGAAVVAHPVNLGQGAAIQTGLDYALRQGARYVATFDGDGQHEGADLPKLLAALVAAQADIALGSRFIGTAAGMPSWRRWFLKMAVLFTRLTTGLKLTDSHNGLRLMTADAAARLRITQNGMAHASEILEQIAMFRLRYVEVPVNILYTAYSLRKGQTMLNSVNVLLDLLIGKVR
jgi:glycosyltransferase involved in cell wall biosynthesis